MTAKSMVHWNQNQLCAIDVETTGLDPFFHEICQICILPLDANIIPRRDVLPFYIELKPDFPERIDPLAMTVTRQSLVKITRRGFDKEAAKDMLLDWKEKLKLPLTKYGTPKMILPLAHNWPFDRGFIQNWLGTSMFGEIFFGLYRDTMTAALYLNDRAAMHAEKVPFSKVNLAWVAKTLNVKHPKAKAHDALVDCTTTAACYREMLRQGLLG
jgi:DNA polymerase III epsilon subunit-like protein